MCFMSSKCLKQQFQDEKSKLWIHIAEDPFCDHCTSHGSSTTKNSDIIYERKQTNAIYIAYRGMNQGALNLERLSVRESLFMLS